MEQDFSIQEEISEYVSYDKFNKLFIDSQANLSKLMSDISLINQLEENQDVKQKIRSQMQQLSNQSKVLSKSLMEMTLSFNEENDEDEYKQIEYEEQKVNGDFEQKNISEIQNRKSIQKGRISFLDQQQISEHNNNQNSYSVSQSANLNGNGKNDLYKRINNIQFSREVNYFYHKNENDVKYDKEKIINQKEEPDTLGLTNFSEINDEIYQKRQSEKKMEDQNNKQMKQQCSSFIEDKRSDAKQIKNKRAQLEENKTDYSDEDQSEEDEDLIRDEIQQLNNNQIDENEEQDEIYIQNVERELDNQIRENNQNQDSNIQIGGKNKLQYIVLLSILVLLVSNITILLLDKQGTIFKFISYRYNKYFIDREEVKLSELLSTNIELQQQVRNYQNELNTLKDNNKRQSDESLQTIKDLKDVLINYKKQIDKMNEEKQQQINIQRDLLQQIQQQSEAIKKFQETEELYNNLKQVLELYKSSTQ